MERGCCAESGEIWPPRPTPQEPNAQFMAALEPGVTAAKPPPAPHPGACDTFVFLQLPDVAQDGLQVHVEAVAVAQQLQEVPGAQGAPRVVDELPG